ncbi:Mth938-like domain-containing protein [Plastorhodobacter daqingensis]|uniref:Mth938-like domain-containing protein n=1 Tax=Plastorhodobacter daqingensis TaxID=1387281 RepID=A0ABW2UJF3_9RHOB
MRLNEVQFQNVRPVEGYGPGFFRIGAELFHGGVLLRGEHVAPWGGYDDSAALLALAGVVDVLFIGTGAEIAHLPPDLRNALDEAGIPHEVMASPPAARSYNVLLSEGRRIAAALLPVA